MVDSTAANDDTCATVAAPAATSYRQHRRHLLAPPLSEHQPDMIGWHYFSHATLV